MSRAENTERRPASRLLKTIVGPRNTGLEKVTDGSSRTRRLFKKAVQQSRSERTPEAYPLGYVEGQHDARTMLADFFNSLLQKFFHRLSRSGQDHLLSLFDNRTLNEIRMGHQRIKPFIIRKILFR